MPTKQLLDLKNSLSGVGGDFSVADLSIGRTYEYGASFALKFLAKQIGLGKAIFSTKTQWREDIIAMICGRRELNSLSITSFAPFPNSNQSPEFESSFFTFNSVKDELLLGRLLSFFFQRLNVLVDSLCSMQYFEPESPDCFQSSIIEIQYIRLSSRDTLMLLSFIKSL